MRVGEGGVSVGDVAIAIGALSVVAALAFPVFRARSFDATVESATREVAALRSSARGIFDRTGSWPTPGSVGEIPVEVRGFYPGETTLVHDEYSLQWLLLETVERVEVPASAVIVPEDADPVPDSVPPPTTLEVRSLGRLLVHSRSDELLAELLARYGRDASFVRDSIWTLILGGS